MITDLLSKKIPVDMITGVIVCNAHQLAEYNNESLILRLYRAGNQQGFIKAFSDSPEQITGGFAQLEKLLRWLHVSKVFLWPRSVILLLLVTDLPILIVVVVDST